MAKHRKHYAAIAKRYWETYLPSQLEGLSSKEQTELFQRLGSQVAHQVKSAMIGYEPPEGLPYLQVAGARAAAEAAAEEAVLADLVYRTPEKGTEGRSLTPPEAAEGWEMDEMVPPRDQEPPI